jgi:hypothetical protein
MKKNWKLGNTVLVLTLGAVVATTTSQAQSVAQQAFAQQQVYARTVEQQQQASQLGTMVASGIPRPVFDDQKGEEKPIDPKDKDTIELWKAVDDSVKVEHASPSPTPKLKDGDQTGSRGPSSEKSDSDHDEPSSEKAEVGHDIEHAR